MMAIAQYLSKNKLKRSTNYTKPSTAHTSDGDSLETEHK